MNALAFSTAEQQEKEAFDHVRKLRGFYRHLMKYVVVNLGLMAVNLIATPQHLWFQWVILGWGIGLMAHAFRVYRPGWLLGAHWEKREVEKRLGRPL